MRGRLLKGSFGLTLQSRRSDRREHLFVAFPGPKSQTGEISA